MVEIQRHAQVSDSLELLVTVKTYPWPSARHLETVCTAGITRAGQWIRLYPIAFRYRAPSQQYRLYDWVRLDVRKRPSHKDKRRESYEPVGDIKVVGHVDTKDNWRDRRLLILPHASPSIEHLLDRYDKSGESLGIIRPARVMDVNVTREDTGWSPRQQRLFQQMRLFGPPQKSLEKPSHRFSYHFRCDDLRCTGHTMRIVDWGLCYLYVKTRRESGERIAVEKTREKCWDMVGDDKDAYLYVGTVYPRRSFIVLGVFYPKKEPSAP